MRKLNRSSRRWSRSVVGVFWCSRRRRKRKRHVDFRQFSVQDRGSKIRLHALRRTGLTTYACPSLRIAGGCSASFISPEGLVMTNPTVSVGCVGADFDSGARIWKRTAIPRRRRPKRKKCPDFELDQLVEIRDVSKDVQGAMAGRRATRPQSAPCQRSGTAAKLADRIGVCVATWFRCSHGGVYDLYRYKRYNDVRLVFAPEFSVAQFGGDPDNFNFRALITTSACCVRMRETSLRSPRITALERERDQRRRSGFCLREPGGTFRELTGSATGFRARRFSSQPDSGNLERRGELEAFIARGPQQAREASDDLFFLGKRFQGLLWPPQALLDPQFFGTKVKEEQHLRAATAADAKLAAYLPAWDEIAQVQQVRSQLFVRNSLLKRQAPSDRGLLGDAVTLVRAASERTKPNRERLPGYTDQALVNVQQQLSAAAPVL